MLLLHAGWRILPRLGRGIDTEAWVWLCSEAGQQLFYPPNVAFVLLSPVIANNLTVALFNMPPGDWAAGDRGVATFPARSAEMKDGVSRALEYAIATGVGRLHLMAGNAPSNDPAARATYRDAV